MKQIFTIAFICLFASDCKPAANEFMVTQLSCENFSNPSEAAIPKLSWIIQSQTNGTSQSAWQVLVADDERSLNRDEGNLWNSGKVSSDQSVLVPYGGAALRAGKKYWWKVKVWDEADNGSEWSETAFWQMGLLSPADWSGAQWIGYDEMDESKRLVEGVTGYGDLSLGKVEERAVVPFFRKEFDSGGKIASATLFISGIGQYEASINGQKIGDCFLSPGWSHYDKTVLYNTYDVTNLVQSGENVLGAIVGNGFHYNNRERYRKLIIAYGFPKMICKLQIHYADGTTETILSGDDWQTKPSPVTFTSIYGGEDYDARMEEKGWNDAGFDASGWEKVKLVSAPSGKLKSDPNHPVKVMETFDPVSVNQINDSVWVYDFGQNASGIVSLKINGKEGQQVRLYPAESLNDDSTISQHGSGSPYYYNYTLKGGGEESWQPRFSYYGFRYVQVGGASPGSVQSALPALLKIQALHTRNSTATVGSFHCSNELFNRIFTLINWGIKSNLQSVMTDCPTREKLGWMEQTHLMGNSVRFNFDLYHLYNKLVADMQDAQTEAGLVPSIVPEYINFEFYDAAFRDSPEWGSASIMLPWMIYEWYGDSEMMQQAWPMMQAYMAYLESKANDHILSHGLGDWYDVGPNPPGYAQMTPVPLVATATYFYDASVMAKVAAKLNKPGEAQHYLALANQIKASFNREFFNPDLAIYAEGSQTAMAMPLSMGLVEKEHEAKVLVNFIRQIEADQKAVTAGDVGFHYMVDALTKFGKSELLYEMNNRNDVPGYGYQLRQGATSLAESWQAFNSNSLNHLMLGHLMEWFYQGLGGIRQEEGSVAYKNIVISPEAVGGLAHVDVAYNSPYGLIGSKWEKTADHFILDVRIPVNTTAKICLPFEGEVTISEGQKMAGNTKDVAYEGVEDGRMVYKTGSGDYRFEVRF
jgi:hypothetical protein